MTLNAALSILGLWILVWRFQPWRKRLEPLEKTVERRVSVIIPCRNEERNISHLLASLREIRGVKPEIIVVDDASTDATVEVASKFADVRVLRAPEKPEDWVGKSWACWFGAQNADPDSELFLFTDADTTHHPDSLSSAILFLEAQKAELISAPPFHRCENFFEHALGLFHLLPLVATAHLVPPTEKRVFAIGQYFIAKRASYFDCGGHEAIRAKLVDDIEMARLFLRKQKTYAVYPDPGLYEVQMYFGWRAFCLGWIRLLRLGTRYTSLAGFIETLLVFHLFAGSQSQLLLLAGFGVLAWVQRQHGAFAWWGALLAPLNVLLFIALSSIGAVQALLRKKVSWHERFYADS